MTKLEKMLKTLDKYQAIAYNLYSDECHSEERTEESVNKAYEEWHDLKTINEEFKRCASIIGLMKEAFKTLDFDLNREV